MDLVGEPLVNSSITCGVGSEERRCVPVSAASLNLFTCAFSLLPAMAGMKL